MKSIKLFLSAAAIMLGGYFTNSQAQCVASFSVDSFASAPGTVNFYSTSSSASSATHYWSFPGATTPSNASGAFGDSINVTYPANGWYNVCLTIVDSLCSDSICDSVYIASSGGGSGSSLSLSTNPSNTNCGACTGLITTNVSGGTAPYAFTWSNGATTSAIQSLCAGMYSVTVIDAASDTVISSAIVGSSGGINAMISLATDCNGATVSANVTNGTAPYTYNWSNGATTATAYYSASATNNGSVSIVDANGCSFNDSFALVFTPNFIATASATNETCLTCCDGSASVSTSGGPANGPFSYNWSNGDISQSISSLCPGSYSVTVTDTLNNCSSVVSVNVSAYTCPFITGNITQGNDAMVYLIEESNGILTAVDSTVSDSGGFYMFFDACPGTYYVKAALLPSHSLYSFHVPTYYGNSSLWGTATAVIVSGNTNNIDINLLSGNNTGGPGFIGGAIAQGANRGEGDPVIGAQVNLLNANNELVSFTKTDANGAYEFDNLSYGDYQIFVDIINFDAFAHLVTLSADKEEVLQRNFVVEGGVIKPVVVTGLDAISNLSFNVFPNPASDVITITGSVDNVEIFNILGAQVAAKANKGAENMNINVSNFTSGQYIMAVKQGEQTNYVKITVQ